MIRQDHWTRSSMIMRLFLQDLALSVPLILHDHVKYCMILVKKLQWHLARTFKILFYDHDSLIIEKMLL